MTEAELREARLLLPWYANGSIDEAGRRKVDACLAESKDLRAELDWLRAVRRDVQSAATPADDDLGFATLLGRIEDERAGNVVPLAKRARPRWLAPALAIAASLVLAQAIVIGVLIGEREEGYRPLSGPVQAQGTLLQVRFQPQATEVQIRTALSEVGGELVAGPGALGIYTVRVDSAKSAEAIRSLAARGDVVESVSAIPR